ncbi:MAG: hypothetical protein JW747_01655 [Candidatus Aminicenantes bacterium]|nr:hypothetical protein [Candidatus Aminicenantes bacterium]
MAFFLYSATGPRSRSADRARDSDCSAAPSGGAIARSKRLPTRKRDSASPNKVTNPSPGAVPDEAVLNGALSSAELVADPHSR